MCDSSEILVSSSTARVAIDKKILLQFYLHPVSEVTSRELDEIHKVISIVLNTHFGKYYQDFDDLRSQALMTIMERHGRFDKSMSPYNYLYTMIRNEAGNLLRRLNREDRLESVSPSKGKVSEIVPSELSDLLPYLSGDAGFSRIDVPRRLVPSLLVFCQRGLHKRQSELEATEAVLDMMIDFCNNI